jgi:hypothetical protein
MLDLSAALQGLPEVQGAPPWPGHEYVKGWGVFALPFDSGHVLALRVFPENDFSPYKTVWHRDPEGRWSIYVDGERLDTACPRYYGQVCDHVGHARIRLEWTGPMTLRISVDEPALEWTLTARQTPLLRVMNALSPRMPLSTWRSPRLVRARELMAERWMGLGPIKMSGTMPSGHAGTLMPQRMYFIDETHAVLDGVDLGRATKVTPSPRIGDVPLPARGVLAIGGAAWEIPDAQGDRS